MEKSVVTESELCEMSEEQNDRDDNPPTDERKVHFEMKSSKDDEDSTLPGKPNSEVEVKKELVSPSEEYVKIPNIELQSLSKSPQNLLETKILTISEHDIHDPNEKSECMDSIGDLSERTLLRFNTSFDESSAPRRDSFSSISSFNEREKFRKAVDNIRQDLLPFQSSVSQYLLPPSDNQLISQVSMDSPSDLSPNAPPHGFTNTAAYLEQLNSQPAVEQQQQPSNEGSVDSSGFEKVDHEGLEEFGNQVVDPMQQSVFGNLPSDNDNKSSHTADKLQEDEGFLMVDKSDFETLKQMSHDDVIEKNYFGDDQRAAQLLDSPISEEARKLVQDAVESASDLAKSGKESVDDIAKELLDTAHAGSQQLKENASEFKDSVASHVDIPSSQATDVLSKAQDGLSDFVHEKVPETIDTVNSTVGDFVHEQVPEAVDNAKNAVDEFVQHDVKPVVPEHVKTDNLVDFDDNVVETAEASDIGDTVEQVHNEIDSFLRGSHREPSPPLEADEDEGLLATSDAPRFGHQTPEEDETTFDRNGPLTIPELPEETEKSTAQPQVDDEFSDFDPVVPAAFGQAVAASIKEEDDLEPNKFESVPRPPTPPKDISDEDVKPSVVNLGPAPTHSHPSTPHHSILKHHDTEAWFDFKSVDPRILDLIYWRDPKKSGIAVGLSLLALFILARYPLLSVIAYTGLGVLAATLGFRIFKSAEAQIKKTGGENPFQEILAQDLSLPQERVHAQVDVLVEHGTLLANRVKQLVFVESILDSVKFGLLLWSLTYIASWFSGFALIFLAIVGVFSIPKLYETYQEPIDAHLAVISGHIQNVQNLLEEKLPFLRRPVAAEEKKEQ